MYYTGFADEAGADLDVQIKATKELGWKNIETRGLMGKNLALISDAEFDEVCRKLDKAGVSFNCFGSGIGNWAKPINQPPDSSYDEMRRAIPRMKRLGIKLVRIMSFAVPKELRENDFFSEVVKRLREIVKMAEGAGVVCVHENCMNWAGLSVDHTLRMLEAIPSPSLKLVFDTGNPVFEDDVRGAPPYKKQDSWEFYSKVKKHIAYVHIKDGKFEKESEKCVFTFPGEGDGNVEKIVADLLADGYDGGFSIEPHMAAVHHDPSLKKEDIMYSNYVEYGRRFMALVERARKKEPVSKLRQR